MRRLCVYWNPLWGDSALSGARRLCDLMGLWCTARASNAARFRPYREVPEDAIEQTAELLRRAGYGAAMDP